MFDDEEKEEAEEDPRSAGWRRAALEALRLASSAPTHTVPPTRRHPHNSSRCPSPMSGTDADRSARVSQQIKLWGKLPHS